ncbi:hypothetical protein L3X38_021752 [Prunus dulcis]|uniref:Malectin domain-containing protein n=1 Tax=Prunus dulcis TaxID=3755 RepID=A0AAD4Z3Q8_PRUDU|nr:hypothetical protein L3X38_021752 [Prunus dulcis]
MGLLGRDIFGLIFLVIVFAFTRTGEAQSRSFLINCGTNSSITLSGRKWVGDLATNNNLTLSSSGIAASTSTLSDDSTYGPLYKTARVFTNGFNYTFQGIKGNYFVRLHFSPFSFDNYNVNESSFGVVANGLKLLSEFSVHGEISDKNAYLQSSGSNSSSSLIKEYILAINLDLLVIEFIPAKGSFGCINAIEIVPVGRYTLCRTS